VDDLIHCLNGKKREGDDGMEGMKDRKKEYEW
jgi:hypothetical protein